MRRLPSLLHPNRLLPVEFKAELKRKRWSVSTAAARWNIRADSLSKIIANPEREVRWDDMVRALPHLSAQESRAVQVEQKLTLRHHTPRKKKASQEKILVVPAPPGSRFDEDPEPDVIRGTAPLGLRYQADLDIGDEFAALIDCDLFLREGDLAVLVDRRLGADANGAVLESYCLEGPDGAQQWFTPDDIDLYVAMTGRSVG